MIAGLLFATVTGLLWVAVGTVISNAARRNLNLDYIQGAAAVPIMAVSAAVIAGAAAPFPYAVAAALLIAGAGNYGTYHLMNRAMKEGPNGLTWAMVQCAFLLPFLMGIVFFNVPCPVSRILGILLLLAAMPLMGISGKKGGGSVSWRWLRTTAAAFLLAGGTQCCANLPSYFATEESGGGGTALLAVRIGCCQAGTFAVFLLRGCRNRSMFRGKNCRGAVLLLTASSLLSAVTGFLAMDLLAAAGAGAIAYPAIMGVTIVAFLIYTAAVLRERLSLAAGAAVLLCLSGILLISV